MSLASLPAPATRDMGTHQGPPPHLHPGSGPCGLTAHEWHGFLIFVMLLMLVFLIAVVVAWYHDEGISEMWLRAKHRVQVGQNGVARRAAQARVAATRHRKRQTHYARSRHRRASASRRQFYLDVPFSLDAPSARPVIGIRSCVPAPSLSLTRFMTVSQ
ncbi:hypothetical protein EDB84DRAFT_1004847 [Lactarius hengduanensis]|nr:hypothetical protein EDB84DRAFT_1004847 [Lactarius hengduanensis]